VETAASARTPGAGAARVNPGGAAQPDAAIAADFRSLLRASLASAVKSAEDRELYEAFERYGGHPDADVSYTFSAQAEVVLLDKVADGR